MSKSLKNFITIRVSIWCRSTLTHEDIVHTHPYTPAHRHPHLPPPFSLLLPPFSLLPPPTSSPLPPPPLSVCSFPCMLLSLLPSPLCLLLRQFPLSFVVNLLFLCAFLPHKIFPLLPSVFCRSFLSSTVSSLLSLLSDFLLLFDLGCCSLSFLLFSAVSIL